jgi:hypothetical protein
VEQRDVADRNTETVAKLEEILNQRRNPPAVTE